MADELKGVSKHGFRRVYRMLCFLAWCDDDLDPKERLQCIILDHHRDRIQISGLDHIIRRVGFQSNRMIVDGRAHLIKFTDRCSSSRRRTL